MTSEERIRKNASGAEHGAAICPICGDSAFWKDFHPVKYFEGEIELRHERAPAGVPAAKCYGEKALIFVCDECWPRLSIPKRLKAFDGLIARRINALPPVIQLLREQMIEKKVKRKPTPTGGMPTTQLITESSEEIEETIVTTELVKSESEEDRARWECQKAELEREHELVAAAIRGGA